MLRGLAADGTSFLVGAGDLASVSVDLMAARAAGLTHDKQRSIYCGMQLGVMICISIRTCVLPLLADRPSMPALHCPIANTNARARAFWLTMGTPANPTMNFSLSIVTIAAETRYSANGLSSTRSNHT